MSDATKPLDSAAVWVVADVEASLAYFEQKLGFEVAFRYGEPTTYAGVCHGGATVHLQAESETQRPKGASLLYVFVPDAEAAHRELASRGARLASGLATFDYGLREFAVSDLDGNTLVFASEAAEGA